MVSLSIFQWDKIKYREIMARKKKPLFGPSTYKKKPKKRRPKRHSKRPNNHSKRKKSRGQGRKRVLRG